MSELLMEFSDTVSDARGTFRACVMAGHSGDGRWEGWLEFLPSHRDSSVVYATPVETQQHDRATVDRWASGLSHVYAEGALARATLRTSAAAASASLFTLEELVAALGRRIPQIASAGETEIADDADRLRARVLQRLTLVRQRERTGG